MTNEAAAASCIILAGGEGKRVGGRDKGLVDYKGKPLIEHVITAVSKQVDDIIISANRNIESYQRYSHCVISDNSADYQGPLAGIAASLPHCRHHHVLIVACDMPLLPDTLVERLSSEMQDHAVVIASVGKHHQMALLVEKNQAALIRQRLEQQQLKLIQWVESVSHVNVSFDDTADAFANLNHLSSNH